jgi:hypothetical protein
MIAMTILALLVALALTAALVLLVAWTRRRDTYRCRACGHGFRVSFAANLVSPQWPTAGGGFKYLRCPSCGKRSWAAVDHVGLDVGLALFWFGVIAVLVGLIAYVLALSLR